jgi:hypothetical protein
MPGRFDPRNASVGDKGSAAYWRAVKSGDFVSLADTEAFDEAIDKAAADRRSPNASPGARSQGSGGGFAQDYRVGEIRVFALRGPADFESPAGGRGGAARRAFGREARSRANDEPRLGEYRFIELVRQGADGGPLYLAAIDTPDAASEGSRRFELRFYFIPAGLEPGTRDDWIDAGDSWLFLPPPDPEDFISSELEFAPYPDLPEIEEKGRSVKRIFGRVGPGTLYAEALDTEAPVMIAEYAAEPGEDGGEAENPLMILIEEGWMRSDGSEPEEGGYLTMMLGKVARASEIEHWPT